jgi:hypothetical protein
MAAGPAAGTTPEPMATASRPIALDAGTEVRSGQAVYTIVSARADRYAPGRLALRFEVRMTNNDRFDAVLTRAAFRLVVDGVLYAPEDPLGLSELVPSHSARSGVVEFVIPESAGNVGLQIAQVGEGAPSIPVPLASAKP